MALTKNQFLIEPDTIYELNKFDDDFSFINSSMFFKGTGNVNVYTEEELPASKAEMQLEHSEINGHKSFDVLPKYIYVEVANAPIEKIMIIGSKPTAV